jgi:cytoskeletal protein CcmA (bactofilin family)
MKNLLDQALKKATEKDDKYLITLKNNPVETNCDKSQTSFIAMGTSIVGEIISDTDIEIVGDVQGSIDTKGCVVVKGFIQGNIVGTNIFVKAGQVQGNITAHNDLIIENMSKLEGNVEANHLTIEDNTVLHGDVKSASISILAGAKIYGTFNVE